nr:hypothetical protein [Tanacetum cinerariifolium]
MLTNLAMQRQSPLSSGSLPSNTITNPRGEIKAITTQSGIVLDGPSVPPPPPFASTKEVEHEPKLIMDQPSIPYPSRLNKEKLQDKSDIQVHKFLRMFKKLHFNISLAEALVLILKSHKLLKDLLSDKMKIFGLENTSLTENYSAKKLSLPNLTPTHMTLELDTRSIAYPAGIAEDVFMQVGKFTFPVDFIVVNYDINPRVPLILRRPFLRTVRAPVDVHGEELILRDGDEKLIFHADSTLKHPHKHGNESISMTNFIDITCKDCFPKVLKIKKTNHPSSGSTTPLSDSSPSLTPFETSDFVLEEFANELDLLDLFPPGNEDDNFNFEVDLRKNEYLLNQDPSIESNIEIIDFILEKFTAEPTLDYSPPLGDDDDDDDDRFELKFDNDEWKKLLYGESYKDIDSEKDKKKDLKMKLLINEAKIVESNDLLP